MAVLVLAEKPSVAQAIGSALEEEGKKGRYIEGDGFITRAYIHPQAHDAGLDPAGPVLR